MITLSYWTIGIVCGITLLTFIYQQFRIRNLREDLEYHQRTRSNRQNTGTSGFHPFEGSTFLPADQMDAFWQSDDWMSDEDASEQRVHQLMVQAEHACASGRLDDAVELAQQALDEVNQNLGRQHYFCAMALCMLGQAYYLQGNLEQAKNCWEPALQIASEWPDRCRTEIAYMSLELGKVQDELDF